MPFAGRHVLELPEGPIAVTAQYTDNPRRSNWGGKTAFIEAVRWCLFDTHRKRTDDAVINRDAGACLVEVEVTGMIVRRERKRGKSTVLTAEVPDGTLRGAAAQQKVLEFLGMTLEDYEATVDFRQDDLEAIVGLRTGKRREIISAWLRLERWLLAGKRAGDRLKAAQQKLVELRAELKAGGEHVLDDADAALLRNRIELGEKQLTERRRALATLEPAYDELGDPDSIAAKFDELDRLRARVEVLKPELATRKDLEARKRLTAETRVKAAANVEVTRGRLRDVGEIYEDGFDGRCPVTCDACPVAMQVQATVQQSLALYDEANAAGQTALQLHSKARDEDTALENQLKALDRLTLEYNAAIKRGRELATELKGITREHLVQVRAELAKLDAGAEVLEREIQKLVEEVAADRARLEASTRASDGQARREKELAAAEREARIASLMVRALGPAGIPARIARAHVTGLELAANELLTDTGLSIEFAWERATQEPALTCGECGHVYVGKRDKECPRCGATRGPKMSDELEILVDDASGEIEDVKMKSGAAKVLVAAALRLAASAMLREVRGTPVGWAMIDEPFGPLDAENREGLARVFGGMLGAVGLEQAFVVSHDVALLDALPNRIVIERSGSVSTLRLESA